MSSSTSPRLLTAYNYHQELLSSIEAAEQEIVLVTMEISAGRQIIQLFEALERAAKRRVAVTIIADNYSKLFNRHAPHSKRYGSSSRSQQTEAWLKRIEDLGVTIIWVGVVGLNPFKGRMHVKFSIVDNAVFAFGGVNLTDEGFENTDYMLYYHHFPKLRRVLGELANEIGEGKQRSDRQIELDSRNTILYDAGLPGRSIIYRQAIELLQLPNRKTVFVSQFCPRKMAAAAVRKNGVKCYFNKPWRAHFPASIALSVDTIATRIKTHYDREPYLHAKCIVAVDGSKTKYTSLTGSHNYSDRGVVYGTKELALFTHDPFVGAAIQQFLGSNVA